MPIVKPSWANDTSSPSMTKASPRTSFVIQRPSQTLITNQPSVAGARPPSVSSRRASSTIRLRRGETLGRSGTGPLGLNFAVFRRCGRHELLEQPLRRRCDLVDRPGEGFLVRLRGLREAADLADVLERGVADLLVRSGWLEVVERVDVPAHAAILEPALGSGQKRLYCQVGGANQTYGSYLP